ncbi:MAG: hypothetical protein ACRDP1_16010 [Nocardioidaceae bacterium]
MAVDDAHVEPYPSLDVVRGELDQRVAEQQQRSSDFDNRAGLLLGFAGVLIGLGTAGPLAVHLAGQVLAAAAGGAATWSLMPRISAAVSPRQLRNRYLAQDVETTKLSLLDTHIYLYEADDQRLTSKARRMRLAAALLALAVLLMLAGSIVDAF